MGYTDLLKDGVEFVQYWRRFVGRRVRVWPHRLTIPVCAGSVSMQKLTALWNQFVTVVGVSETIGGPLLEEVVTSPSTLTIDSLASARLIEGTITDVVKAPLGLYLTEIEYWLAVPTGDDASAPRVQKIESADEAIFLPYTEIARVDFLKVAASKT